MAENGGGGGGTPRCLAMFHEAVVHKLVGTAAAPAINEGQLVELLEDEDLHVSILENNGSIKAPIMQYYSKTTELENALLKKQSEFVVNASKRKDKEKSNRIGALQKSLRDAKKAKRASEEETKAWKKATQGHLSRTEFGHISKSAAEKLEAMREEQEKDEDQEEKQEEEQDEASDNEE